MPKPRQKSVTERFKQLKKKVGFEVALVVMQNELTDGFWKRLNVDDLIEVLDIQGIERPLRTKLLRMAIAHPNADIRSFVELVRTVDELIGDEHRWEMAQRIGQMKISLYGLVSDCPRGLNERYDFIVEAIALKVRSTNEKFEGIFSELRKNGLPNVLLECLLVKAIESCTTPQQACRLGLRLQEAILIQGEHASRSVQIKRLPFQLADRINSIIAPFADWSAARNAAHNRIDPVSGHAILMGMVRAAKTLDDWCAIFKSTNDCEIVKRSLEEMRRLA